MDVKAYRVAVRLALDDQITRNLLQVSRDAIELNKKFLTITRNIKALTSAAREATSALRALNRSLNNMFSGASRGAREYAGAIREIADQTQRINRASRNVPLLAGSYGAAITLPVRAAAGAAAAGGAVDMGTMAEDLRCLLLQETVAGGMAGITASLLVDGVALATAVVMAGHQVEAHIQPV